MNKNILFGIIALVLVAGGAYATMGSKNDDNVVKDDMDQKMMDEKQMKDKDAMMKKDEMMKDDMGKSDMMKKDETSMVKPGSYVAYSADKLAMAATGDVVLFFHASWCPSCRGLDSDINKNLQSIPENVTILKLDYDKETELKKKYGVTSQHTLVQVDKDGNMIKKWSGGSSLSTLLSQIQ